MPKTFVSGDHVSVWLEHESKEIAANIMRVMKINSGTLELIFLSNAEMVGLKERYYLRRKIDKKRDNPADVLAFSEPSVYQRVFPGRNFWEKFT